VSAPFPGTPAFPFNTAESEALSVQPNTENQKLAAALAALDPPRAYYQQYLSTRQANDDMWHLPQTVAPFQPSAAEILACKWLTEPELGVYAEEYGRTGFQVALQAYRVYSDPDLNAELRLFSGRTIDVPSLFIGGTSDWGTYSAPGAVDLMGTKAATRMGDIEMIDGAAHWIQQEQPVRLGTLLLAFAKEVEKADHTRG